MPNVMNTTQNADIASSSSQLNDNSSCVVKKPISSTLRALSVGDSATFPIEQRTSLLIVANRIKKELARIGWDYFSTDNEEEFTISIKRIK